MTSVPFSTAPRPLRSSRFSCSTQKSTEYGVESYMCVRERWRRGKVRGKMMELEEENGVKIRVEKKFFMYRPL